MQQLIIIYNIIKTGNPRVPRWYQEFDLNDLTESVQIIWG